MKVGGKVKLIITVKSYLELRDLVNRLIESQHPYVVLGGGSNVIFSNDYSPIAVIINRTADIAAENGNLIRVNSGVFNQQLINWCVRNRLSGLEFLAGIPGTIGGAAAVNAGAFQKSMADVLKKAEVLDTRNKPRIVEPDYFRYSYRNSVFRTGSQVILNLFFSLSPDRSKDIQKRIDDHLVYRRKNHPPYSQFTAGCFFKNPLVKKRRISAGKIIQDLDINGHHFDTLQLSDKHANFLINMGGARFEDIKAVESKIVGAALSQKGIPLEREVIYITSSGEKQ
jgi:UDP-N-acetylmuramate dehydrogenase